MLEDDELDFEDFGDLGEYDGAGLPEMTTEELEKQLAMELEDMPTETEKPVDAVATTEKKDAVVEFDDDLDEGEIIETDPVDVQDKNGSSNTKPEGLNKPLESAAGPNQQHQRYNNYNNNGYNKNFYGQQQFTPDMMAMNGMFPYPQFSNRIYVNPKFNNGGGAPHGGQNPQQLMAQQQQMYMEMEAKRMTLLQHQQQLLMHKKRQEMNRLDQQRAADLDQKRRETAEMMRKRRESLNNRVNASKDDSHAGDKRKADDNRDTEIDRDHKRQEVLRKSPAGGISIKGAAAAAAARGNAHSSSQQRNTPYTPHHQQANIRSRIGPTDHHQHQSKPSITSRLSRPSGNDNNSQNTQSREQNNNNKHSSSSITASVVPIVTGGKSNTLTIKGFSSGTKDQDIKDMTSTVPGGAKEIQLNMETKTATVVFPSVEAAVTFRRKYNRIKMGESLINIAFQK